MVGFISGDIMDSATLRQTAADRVPASDADVLGAVAGDAVHSFPSLWLAGQLPIGADEYGNPIPGAAMPDATMLDGKTATEKYGIPSLGLKWDSPVAEMTASELHDVKHDQAVRADMIARRQGGLFSGSDARTGVSLLTSLLDPLNWAATFVPGVPEAKLAAAFGESVLGRVAARAVAGASQGVAGQAALLPLGALQAATEHDDFTMGNALGELAFGGLMGGALHSAIGGLGDVIGRRYARSEAGAAVASDPALGEALTRTSVAQMAEGRPVEVEPLVDTALAESHAVGQAYDQVRATPQGPANDPLVRITPEDIDGAIIERGGWKGIGDVTVQGSGWGLTKIIFRHGEGSTKDPAMQVTRDDLVAFPRVIRDFEPTIAGSGTSGREWRVSLPGPTGDLRTVVFGDAPFDATDGERRIVTAYVQDPRRPDAENLLSKPRAGAPGSSSELFRPLGDTAAGLNPRTPQGRETPAAEDIATAGPAINAAAAEPSAPVAPIRPPVIDKLPPALTGAKPRYGFGAKNFALQFESDTDRALFITAQKTKSPKDGAYRDWLRSNGLTDAEIDARGAAVRAQIKELARASDPKAGPLSVAEQRPAPASEPSGGAGSEAGTASGAPSNAAEIPAPPASEAMPEAPPQIAPGRPAPLAPTPTPAPSPRGKPPRARQPVSLLHFLASRGGLARDAGGDLVALDAHKHLVPGKGMLVRKTGGMTLDRAREAAEEAGYLPHDSTIADLLDGVDEELRGRKQYSRIDQGQVQEMREAAMAEDAADYYAAEQQVRAQAQQSGVTLSDDELADATTKVVQGYLPQDAIGDAIGGQGEPEAARAAALDAAAGKPDDADARDSAAAAAAAEAARTAPPPFDYAARIQGLQDAEAFIQRAREAGALSPADEAELQALEDEWTDAARSRQAYEAAAACIARGGTKL
jgi:hypothetical protein